MGDSCATFGSALTGARHFAVPAVLCRPECCCSPPAHSLLFIRVPGGTRLKILIISLIAFCQIVFFFFYNWEWLMDGCSAVWIPSDSSSSIWTSGCNWDIWMWSRMHADPCSQVRMLKWVDSNKRKSRIKTSRTDFFEYLLSQTLGW